jgi:NSS family neurotransmitter:Na+ symporter
LFIGDFAAAISFLFKPDFSKINMSVVLGALGQAFFSVGIGMGFMLTFGAYLPKKISIGKSALAIVVGDTVVAIVAGLAIFPFVFGFGLNPSSGEGLVFETLPVALGNMPGAYFLALGFFLLLSVAALTSQLATLEPIIAAVSERTTMGRKLSTVVVSLATFVFGMGTVLSFNHWSEITLFGETFFGLTDKVVTQITMPLGALLVTIFVAWFSRKSNAVDGESEHQRWFSSWYFLVRYVCPIAVATIFIYQFIG